MSSTPCFGSTRLFFTIDPIAIQKARTICTYCTQKTRCLEGAIRRREVWGVWGGEWIEMGKVIEFKKRSRGRPPARENVITLSDRRKHHE